MATTAFSTTLSIDLPDSVVAACKQLYREKCLRIYSKSQPDPVSEVISALSLSAVQTPEVSSARAELLELVRHRIDAQPNASEIMEGIELRSRGWHTGLALALIDAGADGDTTLIAVARQLLELAARTNSIVISGDVRGIQIGESNIQFNTFLPTLPPIPRELPPDTTGFTGRIEELDKLDNLLLQRGIQPALVVITAVSGTAGVGKTALAIHWAHRLRLDGFDPFPDGYLYIDLKGYDIQEPMEPPAALRSMLFSLGEADSDLPTELPALAARYRSLLDGRRMLVILDNVHNAEQARHLLPGSPTCFVLLTSRDDLAPLAVHYGAHQIDLDILPVEDSVALLRKLLGDARVDGDVASAEKLAHVCAGLPLTIRIVAANAAFRRMTLSEMAHELAVEHERLNLLNVGDDPRTAARTVFSWSYQYLSAPAARLFRLFGLHPGSQVSLHSLSALTGDSPQEVWTSVEILIRSHLVYETRPDQYSMHDLLRAYAREKVRGAEEADEARLMASTRLADYYTVNAEQAMALLYPTERHRRPTVIRVSAVEPHLTSPPAARSWLSDEHSNIISMTAYAARNGWPDHAGQLASTIWRHLRTIGRNNDALTLYNHAVEAAQISGDRTAESRALDNLGSACEQLGRYEEALEYHQQSLAIAQELDDVARMGPILSHLGIVFEELGRYIEARDCHIEALEIARRLDNRANEGAVLGDLGVLSWRLGAYRDAQLQLEQALVIAREIDDLISQGPILNNLGVLYQRLGRYSDALELHELALGFYRQADYKVGEGYALCNSGIDLWRLDRAEEAVELHLESLSIFRDVESLAGQCYVLANLSGAYLHASRKQEAFDFHEKALELVRRLGDPQLELEAENGFAETLRSAGELAKSEQHHQYALTVAIRIGDTYEAARARDGLAHCAFRSGDFEKARELWRESLDGYVRLQLPQATEISRRLDGI